MSFYYIYYTDRLVHTVNCQSTAVDAITWTIHYTYTWPSQSHRNPVVFLILFIFVIVSDTDRSPSGAAKDKFPMWQTSSWLLCRCRNGMSGVYLRAWMHRIASLEAMIFESWISIYFARFITCAMDLDANSATHVRTQRYSSRECSSAITGTWSTVRKQKVITALICWLVCFLFIYETTPISMRHMQSRGFRVN